MAMRIDADAILAEFAARHPTPKGAKNGGGRRLDGCAVPSCDSRDTEAAMRWMEARIDALSIEVDKPEIPSTDVPQPSARRMNPVARARPSARGAQPDFSGGGNELGELAQLEATRRQLSSALQVQRQRVLALRARLVGAGVDETLVDRKSPIAFDGEPTTTRETVAVRPRRYAGAEGTSSYELAEATARRAGVLRRQVPAARAQLDAACLACEQLKELCLQAGLSDSSSDEGGEADADDRHPHPEALLAQLRALDQSSRSQMRHDGGGAAGQADGRMHACGNGCGKLLERVHGLTDGPPVVPVTVFADGFMLYRGPFRPFGARDADLFSRQVMSGHMPHELNMRHPDGLRLELHDKCGVTHAQAHADAAAHRAAAVKRSAAGGVAGVAGLRDLANGADALLAPRGADQLLQRLPASVLRDGNVMPVRNDIAELLGIAARREEKPCQDDMQAVRAARLRRFGAGPP